MPSILRLIARWFYNDFAMIATDLADENALALLAARVARLGAQRDVIALRGDLGTGKTAFARAFIRAHCNRQEEVPSPTFTLVQVYEPELAERAAVWHFDLYRLRSAEEAWELGVEEAFNDGISLIEWPERLGALLPSRRLQITLEFGNRPDTRRVTLDPGAGWEARLRMIAADA